MKKLSFLTICFVLFAAVMGFAQTSNNHTITFLWTAPGDDGGVGTATTYDLRYSVDSVTLVGWSSAIQLTGEPTPHIAGSSETFTTTITLLDDVKYFFAIKTADEKPNWSVISNILTKTFTDTTPPAAIIDLR